MRQLISEHTAVKLDIAEIRESIYRIMKKQDGHDKNIDLLFGYIDKLHVEQEEPKQIRTRVGFKDWE
ncbi:hypothetical protein [Pedobacter alpinus]